jgi:hypothetical protein
MSIKAMQRLWESSEQKGSRLLLLLAIADNADDHGFAWPGTTTLAEKIRMSERHTKRLLAELEETSELYIDRDIYHNRYIVCTGRNDEEIKVAMMDRLRYSESEADEAIRELRARDEAQTESVPDAQDGDKLSPLEGAEEGDKLSLKGDKLSQQGDAGVTQTIITVKEPSLEPSDDDEKARDPVLSAVARLYEQEIGGTMSPMLYEELLELTAQERDLERWRLVFRDSIGKSYRWAWIRKVIANPKGGAKRPSGYKRRRREEPPRKAPQRDPAIVAALEGRTL